MRYFYLNVTNVMVQLVKQKRVLCYDYINKLERLAETALLARAQFYSQLTFEECSEANYACAQRVYDNFKLQTIGDYMRLYLVCDVALLFDVF